MKTLFYNHNNKEEASSVTSSNLPDAIDDNKNNIKKDQSKTFYQGSSIKKTATPINENLCCKLCMDDINQTNFIILSCNHLFHISCLADIFFKDIYNYDILDEDYFSRTKCTTCCNKLELEEIMFLHSKFLSNTKSLITNHENSIEHLENQLKHIRNEIRTCYDYKHKLEKQREKSKQIVSILNTLM